MIRLFDSNQLVFVRCFLLVKNGLADNLFSKFDLYTKDNDNLPDVEKLQSYYKSLADKYMPGVLKW